MAFKTAAALSRETGYGNGMREREREREEEMTSQGVCGMASSGCRPRNVKSVSSLFPRKIFLGFSFDSFDLQKNIIYLSRK